MTDFPSGAHVRIHRLLDWTENDVWRYIRSEQTPVVPLYFARPYPEYDDKIIRFHSIGEKGITFPIGSDTTNLDEIIAELEQTRIPEKSGRPKVADEDSS